MRARGAPKQPVTFSTDATEKFKDQKKNAWSEEIAESSKLLEKSKESQNSDYSED